MTDTRPPALTALYVPASRPELFAKALDSIADRIILDLEDAVPHARKDAARADAVAWLMRHGPDPRLVVRVNDVGGATGRADLAALATLGSPAVVRVPKAETADELQIVRETLGDDARIECLIESALGLENRAELARAPGVVALALGETDLMSELGARSPVILQVARAQLVMAARAAGLPAPMMAVFPDFRDTEGLRRTSAEGRATGFVGRTAIHPSQLLPIVEAFRPSDADVEQARRILDGLDGGGAIATDDGMIDPAMAGGARRVLELEELAARAVAEQPAAQP